jgi:hypothetical protein
MDDSDTLIAGTFAKEKPIGQNGFVTIALQQPGRTGPAGGCCRFRQNQPNNFVWIRFIPSPGPELGIPAVPDSLTGCAVCTYFIASASLIWLMAASACLSALPDKLAVACRIRLSAARS